MIRNSIRAVLDKTGKSQSAVAKAINVTPAVMSAVVKGSTVLERDEMMLLCEELSCSPTDLYAQPILDAIYEDVETVKRERNTVTVRVPKELADWLDSLVEQEIYESRKEAVVAILYAKRRQCRGWKDDELGDPVD